MSQFSFDSIEDIETQADKVNCVVVVAKDNELQFDLDSTQAIDQWQAFMELRLKPHFKEPLSVTTWKSKSGNTHAVVVLPETPEKWSVEERIAMQSQGGSDPGREWAALCCHWQGSPHPLLLFRPKSAGAA